MADRPEMRSLFYKCDKVEIRASDDGKNNTLFGYAAVFERLSEPIMWFREKIQKGAFSETLTKNKNVRALWNHDRNIVLGSTKANTLRLNEDEKGLYFEIDLPDTQAGRDAGVSISRGDVDGVSFAFSVRKEMWDESDPQAVVRTLVDVDLFEISPTAFPAYPQTSVNARSIADDYKKMAEERALIEKENNQRLIDILKMKTTIHERTL